MIMINDYGNKYNIHDTCVKTFCQHTKKITEMAVNRRIKV